MAGVNKVILVGNLGRDPEVRTLENGVKVARFTLATTESYRDRNTGEKIENTEWHNLVLWRGLAEISEKYLKKGSQIYAEGKLRSSSYQDKDNITRYRTDIVVDNLNMLGGKPSDMGSNQGGANTYSQSAPTQAAPKESANAGGDFDAGGSPEMDDLPF